MNCYKMCQVSGLGAVEGQLKNGSKYRFGTDKPVELFSANDSVIVSDI